MVVGVGDEPGVDLHEPGVQPLLVDGQRLPHRHVRVVRGQCGALGDDPQVDLALVDDLPVLVPPRVELPRVLVGPLLGHVVRGVPGAGGVVEEERLVRGGGVRVLDELDRLVRQVRTQVVTVLGQRGLLDLMVVIGQLRVPLVGLPTQEPVVPLEPPPQRPPVERAGRSRVLRRGQVPLAHAERVVAQRQQHLREHPPIEGQDTVVPRVPGRSLGDARQPQGMVIAPGQNGPTRRGAQGRGVHVRVPQPLGRQAVEHRSLHQAPERRQLTEADIIEDEEHHVRRALRRARGLRPRRAGRIGRPADDPRERRALRVGADGHDSPRDLEFDRVNHSPTYSAPGRDPPRWRDPRDPKRQPSRPMDQSATVRHCGRSAAAGCLRVAVDDRSGCPVIAAKQSH